MSETTVIESKMDDIFKEIYRESLQNGDGELMSYFGGFSTDLVGSFTDEIEQIMKNKEAPKTISKRMFSVMVEGLQNICIHGKGILPRKIYGHIMLIEKKDGYRVSFGNLVDTTKKKILTKHIERINGMTPPQLKEYYLDTLSKGGFTDNSGAGLGIITIALKFSSKIEFQFKPSGKNLYYYNINVDTQ